MDYKKISAGLSFLMTDKRITIVHGVLKSLGISPRRDDYDDFVQEASIIFAQAYADYLSNNDGHVKNERDLMCFAYQRIRWRLLDSLRRQQLESLLFTYSLDNEETDNDYEGILADPQAANPFTHLENSDFLGYLYQHSTINQQRYLVAKLNYHLSDCQIAKEYAVTRAAVSYWRRGVITRAHQLRAKMKGEF
ncbi:RNA polymerase subunit sigma-24 [Limosilactobacillus sp. STM2_1]|uniref:RNA polymerase subunit sigma-24 n=1 Tax=Limosilactobacillus rudii TaxID=2759755 RepID=A0A7W3UJM5_9LACO|nr:RNA polymerase subunit sigma-24 [Limosilactobacillus rudii]MBB1080282.1 RNA polymerase subunit sigma-24 [Limosilactobacillus rudii]MBB1096814.1 RNA polymerase subunit sigma-24 [Limosilactobacillus rudii]MCD7133711.1 RNA polymerase subunit sigma-24 [Limosilactobacillus rudii]